MKKTTEQKIKQEHLDFIGETAPLDTPEDIFCGYENMKVTLLSPTTEQSYIDWIHAAYAASFETWYEVGKDFVMDASFDVKERRLLSLLRQRPISVAMESITFVFRMENVSRAITHQIVRHRKMAFGQQSLRVADPSHSPIRLPQSLLDNPGMDAIAIEGLIKDHYSQAKKIYYHLVKFGIPREQARSVLPMATTTSINCAMTLRAMKEYIGARTGDIAQDEHTYLVNLLIKELKEKQPKFYEVVK